VRSSLLEPAVILRMLHSVPSLLRSGIKPDPHVLKDQLATLTSCVKFAMSVVPRVEVLDRLWSIAEDNPGKIRDFSFDIYCPRHMCTTHA
jgi:hypothetical protein